MTIGSPYPRRIFLREFQPIAFTFDDAFYHQTKTLISFWYKRGLNLKSII